MKKYLKLILVIIWMIFIFMMSSFDATESGRHSYLIAAFVSKLLNIKDIMLVVMIIRKLAHFTEFLILGILVSNWLKEKYNNIHLNFVICAIYAISDEVHQLYVPGRSCEIRDMLIDILGSMIGILVFTMISKKIRK